MQEITITKSSQSRASEVDINHIPMGICFTDHMFICDYSDGQWKLSLIHISQGIVR